MPHSTGIDGFVDPILINKLARITDNAYPFQRGIASGAANVDPRRNIYNECGFPEDSWCTPENMYDLYSRDPIASRVVEIWPKECWQVSPEVYDDESPKITTPFEIAWDALGKSLVAEPGYHKQEKGSAIWEYLLRADIMCGIGRYGVILLGTNDGKPLNEPLLPSSIGIKAGLQPLKLTYLRVFPESLAKITKKETVKSSPRVGQPTEYQITLDGLDDTGISSGDGTQTVHWTRVVHIVDNIQSNEVTGEYRIKPVLNEILTCQKPAWGSGEMYWKGAAPKISFETHPSLGGDVDVNKTAMRNQMEDVMNGLQQYWLLRGMSAKNIAPSAVDPTPYIDAPTRRICIKLGVPVPVFIGYEVGENAGTMNTEEWGDRVAQSQNGHRTPRVIAPFTNRLINMEMLPIPPNGYSVFWPDITKKSEKENAQVGAIRTAALANYARSDLRKFIGPIEFMVEFMGMDEERAKTIVSSAEAKALLAQPTISQPSPNGTGGSNGVASGAGGGTGNPRISGGGTGLAGSGTDIDIGL